MQVTAFKSTDGKFFESFDEYKIHEEALQISAKLSEASLNYSAFGVDDRDNEVLYREDVPAFVAANAHALREILNSSAVVKRGRGPSKAKAAATAEQVS